MADVFDAATRSRIMRAIRSRDTKPEVALRRALEAAGAASEPCGERLPGRPDAYLPGPRIAVFADGDFWHCCPVHSRTVAPDRPGWAEKLTRNIERDRRNEQDLLRLGVIPVRVWECELNRRPDRVAQEIRMLSDAVMQRGVSAAALGWAAGLMDGEGTITIMKGSGSGRLGAPYIAIGMAHAGPLQDIAEIFGIGKVKYWSNTRTSLYGWKAPGSLSVGMICRWLKCFLRLKRAQAELVSVWCGSVQVSPHRMPVQHAVLSERALILEAVRALNARGRGLAWRDRLSEAARRSWQIRRPRGEEGSGRVESL